MSETIRCPSCRGAKKVPKLGGIVGECNTCAGKGTILAADKPKPSAAVETITPDAMVIKAVADAIPTSNIVEPIIKVDGKKALYKRKTVAK